MSASVTSLTPEVVPLISFNFGFVSLSVSVSGTAWISAAAPSCGSPAPYAFERTVATCRRSPDSLNVALSNASGTLGLNLNDNDASGAYNLNNGAAGTFQLGGTLGQGGTFTDSDNGNVANNGNTTGGGAPTVNATGDIQIVDPGSIPTP